MWILLKDSSEKWNKNESWCAKLNASWLWFNSLDIFVSAPRIYIIVPFLFLAKSKKKFRSDSNYAANRIRRTRCNGEKWEKRRIRKRRQKRRENEIDSGLPVVRTLGNLPILQVVDTLVPLLLSSPVCQLFELVSSFLRGEGKKKCRFETVPWERKVAVFPWEYKWIEIYSRIERALTIEITADERDKKIVLKQTRRFDAFSSTFFYIHVMYVERGHIASDRLKHRWTARGRSTIFP